MTKRKNKKEKSGVGAGMVVAGLVAAAAAGAYWLSTPKGKRARMQMKGWMIKAKGEVIERLEDAKDINREVYEKIVDEVAESYRKLKRVDVKELGILVDELKDQWEVIKKEAAKDAKVGKKSSAKVKKAAKKAVKRTLSPKSKK